ncbi:extracellular solute-binding protein [Spirillospora sp. NBC_01491]|uniref:extracellular solute-binding protein n=1 Tax=Spirillospora sp. NBC_01491 TaxID=2976007 RepID=UPI002E32C66B|nr:extracellular solute-binding protein [Spirillospora sp. NBC_01491]
MKIRASRFTTSISLLAAATALTASACGGGGDSGKGLTVWMYPVIPDQQASSAYWKQIEKDFEAAEAGVDLKIELQPWDGRDQKVATALTGGKGPDVVLLQPDQIPSYAANRTLAPVDGGLGGDKSAFLPTALAALSSDGKLYGVPIYHTVTSMMFNKKLLDKAGVKDPPQTWDEIKAAAPKLKKAGYATLDYSASPEASLNMNFYPLLWQAGGTVFSPDGKKVAFNGPEGLEALTFLTDLYKQGAVPRSALTNKNVITDQALGKQEVAAAFTSVPADAALAAKTWGKENVIVGAPLKGPRKQVAFGMPGGLAVNARAKNGKAAEKFLRFMTSPKQITGLSTATGFMSPRTDVKTPATDPAAQQFADALQYTYPGDTNASARQVMALLRTEIQAALTGKKTPKEALDEAAEQSADLLARQR